MSTSDTCTQLISFDSSSSPSQKEIKEALEKGNNDTKREYMEKVIMMHLNGENQNALLMTFIRFVLPVDDHQLKKLSLYFLEIVDKTDQQKHLLPEMILICSFLRNDLQHANEYVRGCTLRFVSRLKENELIEPLTDSIIANLDHRHSYVRRNAVMAVFSVYQRFPAMLPDAPEQIEKFLEHEQDLSAKRNAFLMLFNVAQDRAVRYLRKALESDITQAGDTFQLVLVDLLRTLCKTNPQEKGQYLRVVFTLLSSKSPAVLFQCANTLLSLSTSQIALKEAASTFVSLLNMSSDNNVRLIVLDRLVDITKRFPEVLQDLLMDLLRTLATPNIDIRRKVLDVALDLVSQKNADRVVQFLKKEIVRTQTDVDGDKAMNQEYRQMLVRGIHRCAVRHPAVAPSIATILLDYVVEPNASAVDVIVFVREIMTKHPAMRDDILQRLVQLFPQMQSARVMRNTMWLFGVQWRTEKDVLQILQALRQTVGDFPLQPVEKAQKATKQEPTADANDTSGASTRTAGTVVREDGTYVTSLQDSTAAVTHSEERTFRNVLCTGNFFDGAVMCSTLTKLVLGLKSMADVAPTTKNTAEVEAVEIMNELIRLGSVCTPPMDDDSHERILLCQQLLKNPTHSIAANLVTSTRDALEKVLKETQADENDKEHSAQKTYTAVDAPIIFSQLMRGRGALHAADDTPVVEDVTIAASNEALDKKSDFIARLNRVMQLTGFSDPVYCEATVTVHQFDILLDILLVNQTNETLQNLTVELATMGDLKLCERAQSYTLGPREQMQLKQNIKVSSTETGVIFGNVVYDASATATDRSCVILNDIHIDIMDYIHPAYCPGTQFRTMWAEFEWENKVTVNTDCRELREYLDHIIKCTNMKCITPESSLTGDCNFLSANLYAKSSFGEDALANISIEKSDEKIQGFVRIRAKTQGIALSLGDKITMKQIRSG